MSSILNKPISLPRPRRPNFAALNQAAELRPADPRRPDALAAELRPQEGRAAPWSASRSRRAASPRPKRGSTGRRGWSPPASSRWPAGGLPRRRGAPSPRRSPRRSARCSTTHGLSRRVRLGIANQRVVVRTLRLPAIESPEELDAAVRFSRPGADRDAARAARGRAPRGRRRAGDGGRPAADRRDRGRRPPRHDPRLARPAARRRPRTGRASTSRPSG